MYKNGYFLPLDYTRFYNSQFIAVAVLHLYAPRYFW